MTDQLDFLSPEDQEKVTERWVPWDRALLEGVLVEINISQWQTHAPLTQERLTRLGVVLTDEAAQKALGQILTGGQLELIPKAVLSPIAQSAQQARRALDRMAIKTPFGRMITPQAYGEWKEETARLEATFWASVNYMVDNLYTGDCLVDQVEHYYRQVFGSTWDTLNTLGAVSASKEDFLTEVIADLRSKVPAPTVILARYSWVVKLRHAPLRDEIEQRELEAARLRAERLLSDESLSKERRRIVEEMQEDIGRQLGQKKQAMEQGLVEAEDAFYGELSSVLQGAIVALSGDGKKIKGRGSLGKKKIETLRQMADQVRHLNIFDDQELTKQVEHLTDLLDTRVSSATSRKNKKGVMVDIALALKGAHAYIQAMQKDTPRRRGARRVEETVMADEETQAGRRRRPGAVEIDTGYDIQPVRRRRAATPTEEA